MQIQVYRLVEATSPVTLTHDVNEWLSMGWKLHGSPTAVAFNGVVTILQAVVREEEQPGAWG
jgi:hypothetical protein